MTWPCWFWNCKSFNFIGRSNVFHQWFLVPLSIFLSMTALLSRYKIYMTAKISIWSIIFNKTIWKHINLFSWGNPKHIQLGSSEWLWRCNLQGSSPSRTFEALKLSITSPRTRLMIFEIQNDEDVDVLRRPGLLTSISIISYHSCLDAQQ